mgnify:CR=1 FL=1
MDQWHALNHILLSMPTNGRPRVYGRFKKCWNAKKKGFKESIMIIYTFIIKIYYLRHIYHSKLRKRCLNFYIFFSVCFVFCVWPPCTMFTLCIYLVEMTWGKRPQTELFCDFLEGTKILFFLVHLAFISTTNRKQYRMKKIQNMKILC